LFPGRACAELEKPYVLVTNHVISNLREMVTLLETFANSERQLLIIAEDIKGEAREALVMNKERGSLKVAAMKGPGFGGTSLPPPLPPSFLPSFPHSLLPSLRICVVDIKEKEKGKGGALPFPFWRP